MALLFRSADTSNNSIFFSIMHACNRQSFSTTSVINNFVKREVRAHIR